MAEQVKIPSDVKRELSIAAAVTGRTQGELLAEAWHSWMIVNAAEFESSLTETLATLRKYRGPSVEEAARVFAEAEVSVGEPIQARQVDPKELANDPHAAAAAFASGVE